MTKHFDFKGVMTAIITPMQNGKIDTRSFQRVIENQFANGIQGLVVGGTTGESPTVSKQELKELVQIAKKEVEGKIPIIVGTGSNSTAATIEATRLAADWGADAALVVVPYYNKPPQEGLVAHYRAVHNATHLPLIAYNVPSRTVASLGLESIVEISKLERVIAIKESTGDMEFARKIRQACGPDFVLLSGDDWTCLDMAALGGDGVISVISHLIARPMREWMDRSRANDVHASQEFKAKFKKLNDLIYKETSPIPVKMALYQLGLIASPELRLPLVSASPSLKNELHEELKRLEIAI